MLKIDPPSGNHSPHVILELPRCSDLSIHLPAGELVFTAPPCTHTDIRLHAGELVAKLGAASEFASIRASVSIGDGRRQAARAVSRRFLQLDPRRRRRATHLRSSRHNRTDHDRHPGPTAAPMTCFALLPGRTDHPLRGHLSLAASSARSQGSPAPPPSSRYPPAAVPTASCTPAAAPG